LAVDPRERGAETIPPRPPPYSCRAPHPEERSHRRWDVRAEEFPFRFDKRAARRTVDAAEHWYAAVVDRVSLPDRQQDWVKLVKTAADTSWWVLASSQVTMVPRE
jgi:hypothetical protein